MPNVLSPRDLVFRPDNMDETVPHTYILVLFTSALVKHIRDYGNWVNGELTLIQ